jgi:vacuolar-type H+-ATPase subunit I/STV1
MLEGIMTHTSHISVKCDMSQTSVVADLFAWCQKMGKTGLRMEQQVVNIDDINNTLKWQMGFSEKRKSSLKSTLELMTWIRDRYAKALAELKKMSEAGATGGKSKQEMEDMVSDLQEHEVKVGELIAEIRKRLNIPEGSLVSESSLGQVRRKAAQLSVTVADVERMSARKAPMENADSLRQQEPLKLSSRGGHQELAEYVKQLKGQMQTSGRQWIVVGGSDSGGIVVQEGSEAIAAECNERLATGARVEEVAESDGKVLFQKIEGHGPSCGWVSRVHRGTPLLVEAIETELE